jgi:sec-independent protein translocase protein TatA
MTSLLAFGLGPGEMMVVGLIALLLFGKRLPEVARSLGKGVTEFKKGLHGLEEELDQSGSHRELPHSTETQVPRAPKFEPPTSPPTEARSDPPSSEPPAAPTQPPPAESSPTAMAD